MTVMSHPTQRFALSPRWYYLWKESEKWKDDFISNDVTIYIDSCQLF